MLDTLSVVGNISVFLVFLSGIASFFSPCVIPLLPIYLGYLSGSDIKGEYNLKKTLINTISFVLGISVTFFLLGFAFTNVSKFFSNNLDIISILSGVIIIFFGLFQMNVIKLNFLNKEKRININFNKKSNNPLIAFVMGLAFSFSWTPCIGPTLSSVLLLASNTQSMFIGNLLVIVYTLGFVIPFIFVGIFTSKLLNIFNKYKNVIKYIKITGGVILVIIGIMMVTGLLNNFNGYLNSSSTNDLEESSQDEEVINVEENSTDEIKELSPISDFTLKDQNGNLHTLSEYKGKVVFLNFWATGCPPCQKEVSDIIELYEENTNDNVVIITVVNPGGFLEKDISYINSYIEEKGINFPVLFDNTGDVFEKYYISSIPTTFMITSDSKIFGYISGAIDKNTMYNIINQTLENDGLK